VSPPFDGSEAGKLRAMAVARTPRPVKVAAKMPNPAELVSLVYELTESEDARALVAHVAVAIAMNKPAVWEVLSKARTALETSDAKRPSMRRGLARMEHLLREVANSTNGITLSWLKANLDSSTGQAAFRSLTPEQFTSAFTGVQIAPKRSTGGRVKGGKGNKSSPASILAVLACACGAWGFAPGDEEKARKQILRKDS